MRPCLARRRGATPPAREVQGPAAADVRTVLEQIEACLI